MAAKPGGAKLDPVPILLGVIAVLIGALGTLYLLNYNSFEKKMDKTLEYQEIHQRYDETHLREFLDFRSTVLTELADVKKTVLVVEDITQQNKSKITKVQATQDKYWPPGEH